MSRGPAGNMLYCTLASAENAALVKTSTNTFRTPAPPVQHQWMRPARIQKCERQPFCSQTDGVSVGTPFASTFTSQRGLPSATTKSSIAYPQPHGQRIPTHQSSPSSRASTKSRLGSRAGKLSPSMTRSRRRGPKRSSVLRHHFFTFAVIIIAQPPGASAYPAAARHYRAQEEDSAHV